MAKKYKSGRYPYGESTAQEVSWDMEVEAMAKSVNHIREIRTWLEGFNPKSIEVGEAISNATDALMKLEKAIYGDILSEYKEQIEKEGG